MTSLVCQLLPCREKRESAGLSVVVACRWARRSCPDRSWQTSALTGMYGMWVSHAGRTKGGCVNPQPAGCGERSTIA